ncbi:MAG: hypothetical protein D4R84_02725 [Rhodocyclaceae bacterium]|nr:MAG: hypothetical protein D4R84_02725 [Rhodocyclaceae bacterium]
MNHFVISRLASSPDAFSSSRQLLSALWRSPDQLHQIGALDRQTANFKNIAVSGVAEAVRQALALSAAGVEVYFACAEYQDPGSREAVNASGASAFWLDIDCGEEKAAGGKGYVTLGDAEVAIRQFCKDVGLPEPTFFVSTGGGLHIYWVLNRAIDRETWQTSARKLKTLTKGQRLLADDSRTADIASVLRIPGTLNYKYIPPRFVTLRHATDTFIEYSVMLDAIDSAHGRLCNGTTPRPSGPAKVRIPKNIAPAIGGIQLLQVIVRRINSDRCYDDWIHVGMALHHETGGSDEGFALFDAWSSTGKKYRGAQETEAKWRSFRSDLERPYTIWTLLWMAAQEGYSLDMICAEIEPFDTCGDPDGTA